MSGRAVVHDTLRRIWETEAKERAIKKKERKREKCAHEIDSCIKFQTDSSSLNKMQIYTKCLYESCK
jgi:hypothetical protein